MDKIGWGAVTEATASTATATHSVPAGVGKLTLLASDTLKVEFSNSTTSVIHSSNSMELPASTAVTIDVPLMKFPVVDKAHGAITGLGSKCYLQFQTATDAQTLKIVEH
tara:strand:- start:1859 stop:2185 length:327 start_codon:yes stop_codon:yes gene_type:complete